MGLTSNQDTVPRAAPAATTVAHLALLLANNAGVRAVPLPGEGVVTVGRGHNVDIRIHDDQVSRLHLRITVGSQLLIEDAGSVNGTRVCGELLERGEARRVRPGDGIELGNTILVVRRCVPSAMGHAAVEADEHSPGVEMQGALKWAARAAQSDAPVLILGETGVGKDVLAESIHRSSARSKGPFLRLNCSAFTASLLESELFGHEKGAFTGAARARQGLLQSARGGTVLLDEIGEMPLEVQAKLLLVVERLEVLPVGSEKARRIDVRFLSATHRDLSERMANGLFREDLFYRLNGIPITLPPLRHRVSEIDGLARTFLAAAAKAVGRPGLSFAPEALALLRQREWPGNIRELRAAVERAVVLGEADVIHADVLRGFLGTELPRAKQNPDPSSLSSPEAVTASEYERIKAVLEACGGNQSRASQQLGMSRNTLIARLTKYGIPRPLRSNRGE